MSKQNSEHPLSAQSKPPAGPLAGPSDDVLDLEADELEGSAGASDGQRPFSARLLGRYKGTIVVVALLVASVALPAIWALVVPEYQAEALIQVSSKTPRYILPTQDSNDGRRDLLTQVQIMRSTTVLRRVIEREDVKRTGWYAQPDALLNRVRGRATPPLERIAEAISAEPAAGTDLIRLTAVARDPSDARVLADAVRLEYIRFARDLTSDEDLKLERELQKDRDRTLAEVGFLERKVADALKELRTASEEAVLAQRLVNLDSLQAELERIELDLRVVQEQRDSTKGAADGEKDPLTQVQYEQDAEWQRLAADLQAARQRQREMGEHFAPGHPTMAKMQAAIDFAQEALSEREQELERRASAGVLMGGVQTLDQGQSAQSPADLEFRVELLQIKRKHLQDYVNELRQRFEQDLDAATSLAKDKDELERKRAWLQSIETRMRELEENRRVPFRVATIQDAAVPEQPNKDKRVKLSVAALFGALFAGLAAAYLRVRFSPQVFEAAEVKRTVRGAFLGHLPLHPRQDSLSVETCPVLAEAVRVIRTALLNRLRAGEQIVQLTSATVGSGKTTVATLLARSLAQLGKRVLLVDADVRSPSLSKRLAMEKLPGLIDVLTDGTLDAGGVRPTAIPGLNVLPAGRPTRHEDIEKLANGVFEAQIARWREQYDVILLDSAPLLGTADAVILSRHVDGTVMIVREQHCRREGLVEAYATLSAGGGKLLGTVFVGSHGNAAYGYGYGYGKNYATARVLDVRDEIAEQ